MVAVVNLVGILPNTDIECLVVVSPGSVVDPGFTKEEGIKYECLLSLRPHIYIITKTKTTRWEVVKIVLLQKDLFFFFLRLHVIFPVQNLHKYTLHAYIFIFLLGHTHI